MSPPIPCPSVFLPGIHLELSNFVCSWGRSSWPQNGNANVQNQTNSKWGPFTCISCVWRCWLRFATTGAELLCLLLQFKDSWENTSGFLCSRGHLFSILNPSWTIFWTNWTKRRVLCAPPWGRGEHRARSEAGGWNRRVRRTLRYLGASF